jgi:transposase
MKQSSFPGWNKSDCIEVIESDGIKRVLVKGQPYMSWQSGDDASQRLAIAQLYESNLGTQEALAQIFGLHVNAVQSYITNFARDGLRGLISQRSGPKQRWKLTPRLRSKILLIALKEGILEYEAIQKRLEEWNELVSLPSIRQVLLENGLVKERIGAAEEKVERKELFDNPDDEKQLYLGFNWDREAKEIESGSETNGVGDAGIEDRDNAFYPGVEIRPRRHYSQAQRTYLDQLEQGCYNTYAGGMLFVPLLQHYSFLPTIKRIIDIPTYEGYTLEELCLTLFYFDLFGFRSMEDFKRVYSEEFGTLLGRIIAPSLFTLRRFLRKVKEQGKNEKLIDEFALLYLKKGIVRWGALYIDGHFLPYYGIYPITMGWHGVRKIPMKGSYNFMAADERFNPWIFLIRSSSEDLLQKIPEIIGKIKRIGKRAGLSKEQIEKPIVIFDREGYSAELYRYLDGKDKADEKKRAIFISWAKYTDKWVGNVLEDKFSNSLNITYKIQEPEEIRYFETERTMKKYGKIRTVVIQSGRDKKRSAIYTNANDDEIETETVIQLICRRWGEENLIKELLLKHLINYSPGYEPEEIEEQPLVENPKVKELKQKRANLKTELSQIKSRFGHEVLEEMSKEAKWDEIKKKRILTIADIEGIRSQITLLNQEIDKHPEKISFNEAHGKRLLELNYEKKRFLDCIKVFTYNMKNKMCQLLWNYYDKRKELLPALSMIVERTGYVKLEDGKLRVQLRRFRNPEIDYAARHLCEDLNRMKPVTLDRFRFPIHFEVL